MFSEFHNEKEEEDTSALWTTDTIRVSLSSVSRYRRWLFPVLTVVVFLIVIIVLGTSYTKTSNRLVSLERNVSSLNNVIQSLNISLQHAQETVKDVQQLQLTVDNNKDQLILVSQAMKQLAVVDSLSRTVASLKCSLEHIINNSSAAGGCCPLGWTPFGSSCFFFSQTSLSWNESRVWCDRQDAHLVILHQDKDWDFVTRHTTPTWYWVGLSDWRTGRWEWINQTPYTITRRHWMPGQPDAWRDHGLGAGDEDCAHLHTNGRLNDLHCSIRMRFVCQKHSLHA